jgi:hypothetical protein
MLFDRTGWFAKLQEKCNQPYPEPLKKAIIVRNYPVLRGIIPSYYGQIQKAVKRRDSLSINHRLAAFFASYFDILFAINEIPHPGEKGMLKYLEAHCSKVPPDMGKQVEAILSLAARDDVGLLEMLRGLLDNLDAFLMEDGMDPSRLSGGESLEAG